MAESVAVHPGLESAAEAGWEASLSLRFARSAALGTRLRSAEHRGPLRVQRPFYPAGDTACHVVVLHPPGGVVAGDVLALRATVEDGAHVLLTAPGATKLYRSHGPEARITTTLYVAPGACAEWLPYEVIAFNGCAARTSTTVEVGRGGTYAGWEILCLGRPSAGERFQHGQICTSLRIERDGAPLLQERTRFLGGDALLDAAYGLGGHPVYGAFVVVSPHVSGAWVEAVRSVVQVDDGKVAASLVSGALVVRGLTQSSRTLRLAFEGAWRILRPLYAGVEAVAPRIWST
jgi:urease accessory protein